MRRNDAEPIAIPGQGLSDLELQRLTELSNTQQREAWEEWERSAPDEWEGLLDGSDYQYDPRTGEYRDRRTGEIITAALLLLLSRNRVARSQESLNRATESLIEGDVNIQQWQTQMLTNLRNQMLQQFAIQRGGFGAITAADYSRIREKLRAQIPFLKQFANDINRGYSIGPSGSEVQMTAGRARARSRQYSGSAKEAYFFAGEEMARRRGQLFMQRTLGITDRHCADCLMYASMGVQPIGTLPLPTVLCQCGNNCLCDVIYYSASQRP